MGAAQNNAKLFIFSFSISYGNNHTVLKLLSMTSMYANYSYVL